MNKVIVSTFLGLAVMLPLEQVYAVEKPRHLATDSRILVVPYQKNNVVPIHGTTFINSEILFGKGEYIIDYYSGDPDAWTAKVNPYIRNVLNIKPVIASADTNLDVTTEDLQGKRRHYRFHMLSSEHREGADKKATYAVQFTYPEQERAKMLARLNSQRQEKRAILNASRNPKDYNWAYTFHGSHSIMPLHVFDDGHFTYLQLRAGQDVPAVFAVHNAVGKESVVNYRRIGNTIIVQQISPQFTLRDGKYTVASIFNTKLINKVRYRG